MLAYYPPDSCDNDHPIIAMRSALCAVTTDHRLPTTVFRTSDPGKPITSLFPGLRSTLSLLPDH